MVTPLKPYTALGRWVVRVHPGESMVSTSVEARPLRLASFPPVTRKTYKNLTL